MKKREMEQVCTMIPRDMLTELDNMIENDLFPSRSGIIRRALREFLDKSKILA